MGLLAKPFRVSACYLDNDAMLLPIGPPNHRAPAGQPLADHKPQLIRPPSRQCDAARQVGVVGNGRLAEVGIVNMPDKLGRASSLRHTEP